MPVNKEHLLKIKQHILEEPNRLNMSDWIDTHLSIGEKIFDRYASVPQVVPVCGTVGCIAGWSAHLRKVKFNSSAERDFLGLDSDDLFFVDYWPEELGKRYTNATTPLEKAQVTAEAIDLIIAGDGKFPEVEEE